MAKITEGTTGTFRYEGNKETFVPADEEDEQEPEAEPKAK
jgi:hypothetical protein